MAGGVEARIGKIEQDIAVVSASLLSISKTLEKISEIQLDSRVLIEKVSTMDKELSLSFGRVDARITKIETGLNVVLGTGHDAGCEILRMQGTKQSEMIKQLADLRADRKKLIFLVMTAIFAVIGARVIEG